jgi:death-on-curing protein
LKPGILELLFFHTVAIQQYGGAEGILDSEALEAAAARPWQSFGGADAFPTPYLKAAAICESIIQRHPFVKGNKRTAVAAAAYLLSTFGLELDATPTELEDMAVETAKGKMKVEDIAMWFEART